MWRFSQSRGRWRHPAWRPRGRPAVPMPAGRLGPGPPPSRCLLCSPSFGFVDAVATEFVAISESLPSALQSSICQLAGPGPMIEILRSGAGRRCHSSERNLTDGVCSMQDTFIRSRLQPLLNLCTDASFEIRKDVLAADLNTVTRSGEFSTKSTVQAVNF